MTNMPLLIDMEYLLEFNLIQYYNLPAPAISDWFIKTNEKYIEVEDTKVGEIFSTY